MTYPLPENEKKRLEALRSYNLLDTPPESTFDDFTKIASYLFNTPIAMITLIDEHRQWFKSKIGTEVIESPREHSFCTYTIMDKEVMLIKDLADDTRFRNNPFVLSEPTVRFYAGTPLIDVEGYALGSLCIIDMQPRSLDETEKEVLAALGRRVTSQIEFRRVSKQLAGALNDLKRAAHLIPICSHCKGVRNDEGFWETIEEYLSSENQMQLTHGICPKCAKELYPDVK